MDNLGVPYGSSLILKKLLENPDLLKPPELNEEKKDKDGKPTYDASAAFLGQNLWDKTLPFDEDFKFEYMDLDEFLQENGMAESSSYDLNTDSLNLNWANNNVSGPSSPVTISQCLITPDSPPKQANSPQSTALRTPPMSPTTSDFEYHQQPSSTQPVSPARSVNSDGEYQIPAHEIALATVPGSWSPLPYSQEHSPNYNCQEFDPRSRQFSSEELKPQPMIRKSKKIYVPEDLKDDKYWSRRKKNNVAAKRSRDARRIKENQIVLRAQFLEKENGSLKSQLDKFRKENAALKARLAKYEG